MAGILAPPKQDKEDAETVRRRMRQSARRRLAELRLAELKVAELREQLASMAATVDGAADEHAQATAPIQSRLDAIEQRIIARLTNRADADPADAQERAELLTQLREQNSILEIASARHEKSAAALTAEMERLRGGLGDITVIENQLANELARPDLAAAYQVAQSSNQWANLRYETARKKEKETAIYNRDRDRWDAASRESFDRRRRDLDIELAAAGQLLQESIHAMNAARLACLADE